MRRSSIFVVRSSSTVLGRQVQDVRRVLEAQLQHLKCPIGLTFQVGRQFVERFLSFVLIVSLADGVEPDGARPLRVRDIRRMVEWVEQTYEADTLVARDRAMLLMGFAGAFRRSELVGLDVSDVEFVDQGLVARLGATKTDQAGKGSPKGIPKATPKWCPVEALEAWLVESGLEEGPVFVGMDRWGNIYEDRLSDRAISRLVNKVVEGIGKDPTDYSAHSLRAGLVTLAAEAGKPERAIMQQTGHRSLETVRGYIRGGNCFRRTPRRGCYRC